MPKLKIVGARYGLKKISMTQILRARLPIDLAAAKRCIDTILNGEVISFDIADSISAKELVDALENIGAIVEIEEIQ